MQCFQILTSFLNIMLYMNWVEISKGLQSRQKQLGQETARVIFWHIWTTLNVIWYENRINCNTFQKMVSYSPRIVENFMDSGFLKNHINVGFFTLFDIIYFLWFLKQIKEIFHKYSLDETSLVIYLIIIFNS